MKVRKASASVYAELSCLKLAAGVDLPKACLSPSHAMNRLAKVNARGFRNPTLIRKHKSSLAFVMSLNHKWRLTISLNIVLNTPTASPCSFDI